jgi:arylsulfatase A-like enzyme
MFPRVLFFAIALSALSSLAFAQAPNVLILLTDDQRADTIAALGNAHIITPNFDQLAERGFVFTNTYCLGSNSGAVCTPSRNMFLSGRAYFRFERLASGSDPNLPLSFNAAGYETYHHGKRGNTATEIHKVFQHSAYLEDEKVRLSGEPGKVIVDAALEFLRARENEKPFLMHLEFATPHDPRVASSELMALYDREKIPLPKNFMPLHPFDNGEMTVRDEKLASWPRTEDEIRRHLHDYYAVITGLDREIGRLLDALRASGELENTIVVFTSDHGLAIGSHGLMGKQSLYDHSMKAPLIVAGPGIPRGRSDALVYLHDIFPTLCELAGLEVPPDLDGQSLAQIFRGERSAIRDSLFLSYINVQRAIRDERYKLIRYPQIDKTQLFDLKFDPDELQDQSVNPFLAERMESLMNQLRDWQRKLGDTAPLTVNSPKSAAWSPPRSE